jgi:hypothetical protein
MESVTAGDSMTKKHRKRRKRTKKKTKKNRQKRKEKRKDKKPTDFKEHDAEGVDVVDLAEELLRPLLPVGVAIHVPGQTSVGMTV